MLGWGVLLAGAGDALGTIETETSSWALTSRKVLVCIMPRPLLTPGISIIIANVVESAKVTILGSSGTPTLPLVFVSFIMPSTWVFDRSPYSIADVWFFVIIISCWFL